MADKVITLFRTAAFLGTIVALSGCVTKSTPPVNDLSAKTDIANTDITRITLSVGPCYGPCETFSFYLAADGTLTDVSTAEKKDAITIVRSGKASPTVFSRIAVQYSAIDFSPPKQRAPVFLPDHTATRLIIDKNDGTKEVRRMSGHVPADFRKLKTDLVELRAETRWTVAPQFSTELSEKTLLKHCADIDGLPPGDQERMTDDDAKIVRLLAALNWARHQLKKSGYDERIAAKVKTLTDNLEKEAGRVRNQALRDCLVTVKLSAQTAAGPASKK